MRVTYPGSLLRKSKHDLKKLLTRVTNGIGLSRSENENVDRYPTRDRHPPSGYVMYVFLLLSCGTFEFSWEVFIIDVCMHCNYYQEYIKEGKRVSNAVYTAC